MLKICTRVATASLLALSVTVSSAGVASADPVQKKYIVKTPPKVVVVTPRPRYNNRNRDVALGVAAAVAVGTAIAVGAANAGERFSCNQLERRCDDGQEWACRRLEVREDC